MNFDTIFNGKNNSLTNFQNETNSFVGDMKKLLNKPESSIDTSDNRNT